MAKFKYTAADQQGRLIEGEVDADNSAEVLAYISGKDLKPISISRIKERKIGRSIYLGRAISATDKIFLAKHLALMLSLGTDLFRALDILIADTQKPPLKNLLMEIRASLEKGQPFYTTFQRYPQYFSPVFVNLVKAGEKSGTLQRTFENLSRMLIHQEDLRRSIRSALIYPIVLIIASFLVLIFLVTFALPRIAEVFIEGNFEIPAFSQWVFTIGLFFGDHLWVISDLLAGLVIFMWYFFAKTIIGRRLFARLLASIPVVRDVAKKIAIQRFAGTLSTLLTAGVPILDSLKITADSVGNQDMREALMRIADQGVAEGRSLGESFKKEPVFPVSVSSLIAISEQAGHMDEVLQTLSAFYESEINSSIKILVTFIEPVLLLIIGGIVALIALSVIVPVYQLIGQF